MRRAHSYAPETLEALELLGLQVSVERRRRRWTQILDEFVTYDG